MALTPNVVDVPLGALNQVPPTTAGPAGRLQGLVDAQIRRYAEATADVPFRGRIEPRDAFASRPTTCRSIVDGTPVDGEWDTPLLLAEYGQQTVSVAHGTPRVWNGADWSYYADQRVLTRKTTQEALYTSGHTIQAPDYAEIGDVACLAWTETTVTTDGPLTVAYIAFRNAATGAWVRRPTVLYTPTSASITPVVKVVAASDNFFWIAYNDDSNILVAAYDTTGALVAGDNSIPLPAPIVYPGPWDITATTNGSNTVLVCALSQTNADVGVQSYAMYYDGNVVAINEVHFAIHGSENLAFLRNDYFGPTRSYLATVVNGEASRIWVYEITNQGITHTYDTTVSVAGGVIDSITGYAFPESGNRDVLVSYSQLAGGTPWSPQLRQMHSFTTAWTGATAPLRTTQSLVQSSRAFPVDGEYYALAYYQSGSRKQWQPDVVSVTCAIGDTFVGAASQPLAVSAGDVAMGSPIALLSSSRNPNIAQTLGTIAADNIAAGDYVEQVNVYGAAVFGIPDGTLCWKWSFANNPASSGCLGSRLVVSGSSIPGANSTWDVIAVNETTGVFYTPLVSVTGIAPAFGGGVFTATGTTSLTAMIGYLVQDLSGTINDDVRGLYTAGGSVTISGSTIADGTFSVARVYSGSGANYGWGPGGGNPAASVVWVERVSQTGGNHAFTGTLSPRAPNQFTFAAGEFDATSVGAQLVISADPAVPANVQTLTITSVQSPTTVTTAGATGVLPQVFTASGATIAVALTTQVPYTFSIGGITADYSYYGATVLLEGAYAANNGSYRIVQVNADGSFIATPTNGLSNQANELLGVDQTVSVFVGQAQVAFQPTWFIVPLTGGQAVVGRLDYGLAYADWRTEGSTPGPSLFPFALFSPAVSADGRVRLLVPYRAENVTSATLEVTSQGIVDLGQPGYVSTVGLKAFTLEPGLGESFTTSDTLLLPGPMAGALSAGSFGENGVGLAPEQPSLVSESVAPDGQLALTPNGVYVYSVTFEATVNGRRIYSPPSPSLVVHLSSTNNVVTLGGTVAFPLNSLGEPIVDTFGPLVRDVAINVYRTAFVNGQPTTVRYKCTSDLDPNALAPLSAANASGFAFPDSFTWQYTDSNADADIAANETLYTDRSYLARYPAPPFFSGVGNWNDRSWVIADDAAVWMSGPLSDGDATWFSPAFRFAFSADDRPLALAPMDNYMLVFCERSVWYIPAAQLPDATGRNGALPDPVRLPFPNGSRNGWARTVRDGVAYDSTAGGVWLITRALQNVWLSQPVVDTLTSDVVGLAVDKHQRLAVLQSDSSGYQLHVFDSAPNAWYQWRLPTAGLLLATIDGEFAYQDDSRVVAIAPGAAADDINGATAAIAPDVLIASLQPGNVRGLKRVWEMQLVGTYLGPHSLTIDLSYPGDDADADTFGPFAADPAHPYVYAFNPSQEEASSYAIRVRASFPGVDPPGRSFALELLSLQVGMDVGVGLNKRPSSGTIPKGS